MANIPTVALSQVPASPTLGVRVDPGSVTQSSRALAQAGGALQGVGDMLGRFAMQKQDQVNKGILAQEDSIRARTEAEVDSFITKNPDKPEDWGRFRDQAWKGYETQRSARAKAEKWGTDVQTADKLQTQAYRTQTDIRFQATLDKGMIRQSNARLESSASTYLEAGDVDGAVRSINEMTLFPEQRQERIDSVTSGVAWGQYSRKLDEIGQLPAGKRLQAAQDIVNELDEVDADGQPVNGVFFTSDGKRLGGLSYQGRTQLLQNARGQMNAADGEVMTEIKNVASAFAFGEDYAMQVWTEAFDAGKLPPMTIGDTTGWGATMTRFWREGQMKANQVAATQAKGEAKSFIEQQNRMLAKEQDMDDRIYFGKLTEEDVLRARKAGDINEDGAQRLLVKLDSFATTELMREYPKYSREAEALQVRDSILNYAAMSPEKKDSIGADKRKKMLMEIDYLPISPAAKAKLFREFVQASQVDILGWDAGKQAKFDGRRVDLVESDARHSLGKVYLGLENLGTGWAGTLLMSQEAELTEFFTSDRYETLSPTEKMREAREIVARQQEQAAATATGLIIRDLYIN